MADQPQSSANEPIECKIIAAASDGYVNITPEKCERIRKLLASELLEEAEWWATYASDIAIGIRSSGYERLASLRAAAGGSDAKVE